MSTQIAIECCAICGKPTSVTYKLNQRHENIQCWGMVLMADTIMLPEMCYGHKIEQAERVMLDGKRYLM